MNASLSKTRSIVEAIYRPSTIPDHSGNPLIEALPPYESDTEALASICWQPDFDPAERSLPIAMRVGRLLELRNLMIPLDRHCELLYTLNALLRSGYVARSPYSVERAKIAQRIYELQQAGQPFRQSAQSVPTTASTVLIGLPGMGKTSTVARWCSSIPDVIYHPKHHIYQVPVLRADAPSDGTSLKGFCYTLLHELDARIPGATYFREYSMKGRAGADSLLSNVVCLLNIHCLGLLVIDEAQNFARARKDNQLVMTEIVSALNTLKAPLVFLGTNKTSQVFKQDFRSARRAVGVSLQPWDRLEQLGGPNPDEWTEVVMKLWEFQWVREPVELDEWILQVLYDCSQGVLAILVSLFCATQMKAMLDGSEKITANLIQKVYEAQFSVIHPMIDALRERDQAALQRYLDIAPPLQKVLDRTCNTIAPAGYPRQQAPLEPEAADTEGTVEQPRRPARIRSRVAAARVSKPKAPVPEVDPEEFEPNDYRHAIEVAKKNGTTVYEELIALGLMPTTENLQSLFE